MRSAKTLAKLRDIKDPIKQGAIATELFGTKAEDLGKALFALDPSTAVQSLGKVTGAADTLGDTLRDNSQVEIEEFKRRAEMFMTGKMAELIPFVTGVGSAFALAACSPTAWRGVVRRARARCRAGQQGDERSQVGNDRPCLRGYGRVQRRHESRCGLQQFRSGCIVIHRPHGDDRRRYPVRRGLCGLCAEHHGFRSAERREQCRYRRAERGKVHGLNGR
jgi:hypothetical protein